MLNTTADTAGTVVYLIVVLLVIYQLVKTVLRKK